jgi:deazaflavin-dependent oxidoreductase (nitroreductase family)
MEETRWSDVSFCYVTTRGRRTGNPHTIEIWFGARGNTVYLLSGGRERSDWVKNMKVDPTVTVRVSNEEYEARARIVEESGEDAAARKMLASKYQGWREGADMSNWAQTSLVVALDLTNPSSWGS